MMTRIPNKLILPSSAVTNHSSKNTTKTISYYFNYCILVLLLILFMILYLLIHRIIPNLDNDSNISNTSTKTMMNTLADNQKHTKLHVQKLIEETKMLLNEIKTSNSTLRNNLLNNIKDLNVDSRYINNDIKQMQNDLQKLENGYNQCEIKKYQINEKLQNMIHENDKLTMLLSANNLHEAFNQNKAKVEMKVIDNNVIMTKEIIDDRYKDTSSSSKHQDQNLKWLVIGIPTVSRTHDEDYLLRTLDSVADQLPNDPSDLMYHQILIHVVNLQLHTNPQKQHLIYEKAKAKYSKSAYFLFTDVHISDKLLDPKPNTNAINDPGNANHPGFLVRRQTRSIVTVMNKNINRGKYYLFLEDDMEFCPNGLLAIQYLLNKASRYHPNWLAIRASYGMNGIFMNNKDLDVFAKYLLKNQIRRPPDHLVVEWYAGETKDSALYKSNRANIGFKYNLFNHIGLFSTLRSQKQTSFPQCYDILTVPTVFEVEAYNPKACPFDDIWPCQGINKPDQFKIDWSKQNRN